MPYALFETSIGTCAIAWGPAGVRALELPARRGELERRLRARLGAIELHPPARPVKQAIAAVQRHLDRGEPHALDRIALDQSELTPFARRVYQALRATPCGKTVTYGELAALAGAPGAARAVGRAMATNPFPVVVPCHRVIGSGGAAGGFSSDGGIETKRRLLAIEGVALRPKGRREVPWDAQAAARELGRADRELGALIARIGAPRLLLERPRSTFAALARAIVYQQLTGKAAATIFARFEASVGVTPEAVAAAPESALRAAGLSRPKQLALRDLADRTLRGEVPRIAKLRHMADEDIVATLVRVRGIGRWTVEMLLIFQLGRPDVLPLADYGLRKGYARAFGLAELPSPKELETRGERWRPWRSLASWYLWRATE